MLFKRKVSAGIWERARTLVWPRRSFTRSARYYSKRILRLNASPHSVGAGVAAGVFASFFPLGFHFIIAGLVAWLIAGNLVAAALGTAFGNPLTFPFLWGASYETGKLILNDEMPTNGPPAKLGYMLHHLDFSHLWEPVLKPMTIGAVPLGIACGVLAYFVTRWAMTAFREQRRKRLAEKSARHGAASHAVHSAGPAKS